MPITPAPPPPPQEPTSFLPEQDDDRDEPRSRAWLWVLIAVVLLLALAAGAYALVSSGGDGGSSADVSVPDVVGSQQKAAVKAIKKEGLIADPQAITSDEKVGQVLDQDPNAGELVNDGDTVTLTVSGGPDTVAVPDGLVGMTTKEATAALERVGLQVGEVTPVDSSQPRGTVLVANPSSGKEVSPDTPVDLDVSAGPVTVPQLVGLSQADAETALDDQGLVAAVEETETDEQDPGDVVDQSPAPGEKVDAGSTVTITVAVAPQTTTTTEPTTTEPTTTEPTTTEPTTTDTTTEPTTTKPTTTKPTTTKPTTTQTTGPGGGPRDTGQRQAAQSGEAYSSTGRPS